MALAMVSLMTFYFSAIIINKETHGGLELVVEGLRAVQVEKLFRERNMQFEVKVCHSVSFLRPGGPATNNRRARPFSGGSRIRSPIISTNICMFL